MMLYIPNNINIDVIYILNVIGIIHIYNIYIYRYDVIYPMLLGIDNDQTWQWKIILSLIKNSHSESHQKNMKINGSQKPLEIN